MRLRKLDDTVIDHLVRCRIKISFGVKEWSMASLYKCFQGSMIESRLPGKNFSRVSRMAYVSLIKDQQNFVFLWWSGTLFPSYGSQTGTKQITSFQLLAIHIDVLIIRAMFLGRQEVMFMQGVVFLCSGYITREWTQAESLVRKIQKRAQLRWNFHDIA